VATVTLDHLVKHFTDVSFEVSNGGKRLARVRVEYHVIGSPDGLVGFLQELEREWPFAVQRCNGMTVQVEYLVKPENVEKFCRKVSYRGKKVVVGF
jgi:hypothetical protein